MTERDQPLPPISDPPAPGQSDEPQEAPGADPGRDRDDDDPDDGPIGDRPEALPFNELDPAAKDRTWGA